MRKFAWRLSFMVEMPRLPFYCTLGMTAPTFHARRHCTIWFACVWHKQEINVNFKRIGIHNLPLPQIATAGSAGYDLMSAVSQRLDPGDRRLIPTGFAVQLPVGLVGMVCSRSGLALKHGIFVLNAPGIIDSDYRGEIGVILMNMGENDFVINVGDRIAQLVVTPVVTLRAFEAQDLGDTARGGGGFGSTGQ